MQDIIKFMTIFSQTSAISQHLKENGIATQTEISAVHTPQVKIVIFSLIMLYFHVFSLSFGGFQGESAKAFPFQKQARPSSLPLPVKERCKKEEKCATAANQELRQFAGTLVDGVIKTVSETKADNLGVQTTEITVTDTDKIGGNSDKIGEYSDKNGENSEKSGVAADEKSVLE